MRQRGMGEKKCEGDRQKSCGKTSASKGEIFSPFFRLSAKKGALIETSGEKRVEKIGRFGKVYSHRTVHSEKKYAERKETLARAIFQIKEGKGRFFSFFAIQKLAIAIRENKVGKIV